MNSPIASYSQWQLSELVGALANPTGYRVLVALLHFVWQCALIGVVVALLFWLTRRRTPQTRYLIGLIGLVAMGLAPLITFCLITPPPELLAPRPATTTPPLIVADDLTGEIARLESLILTLEQVAQDTVVAPTTLEPTPPQRITREWMLDRLIVWQPYLLAIWFCGMTLSAIRLAIGARASWWYRWGAKPLSSDAYAVLLRVAERLGVLPPVVLVSERVGEALVLGLVRPVILLPAAWMTRISPELLESILAHEIAHLRRHDLWINFAQRLLEALLFYHPMVWWLSWRVRLEREYCCDDIAAHSSQSRAVYARALEFVATERLLAGRLAKLNTALAATMGGKDMALLNRVRKVLGSEALPSRSRWRWVTGAILVLPLCVLALALNEQSLAQADNPTNVANDPVEVEKPVEATPIKRDSPDIFGEPPAQETSSASAYGNPPAFTDPSTRPGDAFGRAPAPAAPNPMAEATPKAADTPTPSDEEAFGGAHDEAAEESHEAYADADESVEANEDAREAAEEAHEAIDPAQEMARLRHENATLRAQLNAINNSADDGFEPSTSQPGLPPSIGASPLEAEPWSANPSPTRSLLDEEQEEWLKQKIVEFENQKSAEYYKQLLKEAMRIRGRLETLNQEILISNEKFGPTHPRRQILEKERERLAKQLKGLGLSQPMVANGDEPQSDEAAQSDESHSNPDRSTDALKNSLKEQIKQLVESELKELESELSFSDPAQGDAFLRQFREKVDPLLEEISKPEGEEVAPPAAPKNPTTPKDSGNGWREAPVTDKLKGLRQDYESLLEQQIDALKRAAEQARIRRENGTESSPTAQEIEQMRLEAMEKLMALRERGTLSDVLRPHDELPYGPIQDGFTEQSDSDKDNGPIPAAKTPVPEDAAALFVYLSPDGQSARVRYFDANLQAHVTVETQLSDLPALLTRIRGRESTPTTDSIPPIPYTDPAPNFAPPMPEIRDGFSPPTEKTHPSLLKPVEPAPQPDNQPSDNPPSTLPTPVPSRGV